MHGKNLSFIIGHAWSVKVSAPTELGVLNYMVALKSEKSVNKLV